MPSEDSLIEHFHVLITVFVENSIGQTGQVMGASSIQHDQPVARNILKIIFELP